MDLKEIWKKLGEEKLNILVMEGVKVMPHSKHPVNKLSQSLMRGLGFIGFFGLVYLYLFIAMPQPVVKIVLGLLVIFHISGFVWQYLVYKRISTFINFDNNIRSVLGNVYTLVTKTLAAQLKFSWVFFPLSISAGFILGLSIYTNIEEMLSRPVILISLFAVTILITPLCYFLTKRMNNVAYGKYLHQLEKMLAHLEERS